MIIIQYVWDVEMEARFSAAAVPVQCILGEGDPDSWGYPTWSIHTPSFPAMAGQAVQKNPTTSKSVPLLSNSPAAFERVHVFQGAFQAVLDVWRPNLSFQQQNDAAQRNGGGFVASTFWLVRQERELGVFRWTEPQRIAQRMHFFT